MDKSKGITCCQKLNIHATAPTCSPKTLAQHFQQELFIKRCSIIFFHNVQHRIAWQTSHSINSPENRNTCQRGINYKLWIKRCWLLSAYKNNNTKKSNVVFVPILTKILPRKLNSLIKKIKKVLFILKIKIIRKMR